MTVKLFEPYKIRNVMLKNRIVMAPMCMYVAHNKEGMVTPWHITHYASRAIGGVGLIMVEATGITPNGRITERDLGIWDDSHIEGLKSLVGQIKANGASAAIQLAHAGRKSTVSEKIVAPSAIPFQDGDTIPSVLSIEQIQGEIIPAFKSAAIRAIRAGFDVLEIHGAHGYLINQFLSPLSNKRTDEYGGTQENRYRILKEIIDEIRQIWDGPLMVRISANEYHPNGQTPDDYVTYARWLKDQGVDLIDVSSGAVVPAQFPIYPGYQVPLSEKIKREADIPTGAVGLITTGVQAEEILQNERADLIFIGRELLRTPYWPKDAAKELGYTMEIPFSYSRAW